MLPSSEGRRTVIPSRGPGRARVAEREGGLVWGCGHQASALTAMGTHDRAVLSGNPLHRV